MTATVDREARLARYRSFCGCKSSAFMLTAAMIGYPVFLLLAPPLLVPDGWGKLWWGLAVLFAAGLVGKMAGLAAGALLYRWARRGTIGP